MSRFAERTAIVTGAAGEIGATTARRLAEEGAAVALLDRRVDLLDELAAELAEAGAEVAPFACDQTDREAVEATVAAASAALGPAEILFANAGYGQLAPFLETSERQWHRHVDVNLTGTFHVCQAVARQMVAAGNGGAIVVNASSGASRHADQLSAYCTTKAGLRMLAIGMASELGPHRIRVNCVMPGVIETAMTGPMLADPGHRDSLLAATPAGRLGVAADVAALVCFLASGEAGYVNGESVMIDGGQTIHGHPRWFHQDYRQGAEASWAVGG